MTTECNVLITGVGGQGVILISELLGKTAVRDGVRVRGSEVLGMAVRGGPVVSMIRFGDEVDGPLIPAGKADVLLAMEPAEGLRNIGYLSKSASVILNVEKIVPPAVSMGTSNYPSLESIVERLSTLAGKVISIDANQMAGQSGSLLSVNIVMLGGLFGCASLPIRVESIRETLQAHFRGGAVRVNLKAFDLGYQACRRM